MVLHHSSVYFLWKYQHNIFLPNLMKYFKTFTLTHRFNILQFPGSFFNRFLSYDHLLLALFLKIESLSLKCNPFLEILSPSFCDESLHPYFFLGFFLIRHFLTDFFSSCLQIGKTNCDKRRKILRQSSNLTESMTRFYDFLWH